VKKTAIALAVNYHCKKVQAIPSLHSTTSLLLGQVYVNGSECVCVCVFRQGCAKAKRLKYN